MTEEVKIQPLTERQNVSYALSGTDDVGRKIEPAGEATNDRLVGIFYVLWLGNDYSDEGEPVVLRKSLFDVVIFRIDGD